MSRKKKIGVLIMAALTALGGAILAGCSGNKGDKYDYIVTYNYNVEGLGLDTAYADQYLGVKKNSLTMQPVKADNMTLYNNSDFKEYQIDQYVVSGWYLPQLDGEGKPKKDEKGTVLLDEEWDFSRRRVNDNVTLYARLLLKPYITIMNGSEKVSEKRFVVGQNINKTNISPLDPTKAGYTFGGYFYDSELTNKVEFPFRMADGDMVLYERFIEGENWVIVNNAKDFAERCAGSAKLYLDVDELDFTGVTWRAKREFNGVIQGNGCVLKNITCTVEDTINSGTNMGLFGRLGSAAKMENVTFSNVSVTVSTVGPVPRQAALFAWKIESGALLKNVTVSGTIRTGTVAEGGDVSLFGVAVTSEGTYTDCNFEQIVKES